MKTIEDLVKCYVNVIYKDGIKYCKERHTLSFEDQEELLSNVFESIVGMRHLALTCEKADDLCSESVDNRSLYFYIQYVKDMEKSLEIENLVKFLLHNVLSQLDLTKIRYKYMVKKFNDAVLDDSKTSSNILENTLNRYLRLT